MLNGQAAEQFDTRSRFPLFDSREGIEDTMLQLGDEVTLYSVVFVLVLLGTRSPVWTTALTVSLYLFVAMFRFPQVPSSRARQVLHPLRGTVGSGRVSVVAHRGGGHDAPENTIVAIRVASKNGATGVELDLEFSADGVPILMHDETVDRTTNGSGPLCQMRRSELGNLDAAAKHRLSCSPERSVYKTPSPLQQQHCLLLRAQSHLQDEAERPRSGHSTDPPAMEPESVGRRCLPILVAMETQLDDSIGRDVGLGAPSRAVEALWHLSLPRTEELSLTGICPVLGPEGGRSGSMDSQH
ncbi:glycerophosphodiester phosphodiesterase 1 isoform X2 [Gymnodraco acuticeps]|uniref:Glycerophosphodiester phosphodiesterase 1 isoform X2 n=1 Tax=Gymnodraco acuticeps TaxID=8218 RepID=A0A6P8W7U3_GYMAC|nr:glycerophosphodiester phosphodiesterase 1 isoform X2 [Gymnodraco acuticeps]